MSALTPEQMARLQNHRLLVVRRLLAHIETLDARIDRQSERLVAAENVVAAVTDHFQNCDPEPDLRDALESWDNARGYRRPATADEVAEASWELRAER